MVEVLTWVILSKTATLNLMLAMWLFWQFILFQKHLKDQTCICITEVPVLFSGSLPNTSSWPLLREVLKPYNIASFSVHTVKHMLQYFTIQEPECPGIFLTYVIFLPLPYILLIFISTQPPKIQSPVRKYVVKLSCEQKKLPCLLCCWKRNMRKNSSAVYIAP